MGLDNRILKRKYERKLVRRAVGIKKNREFLLRHFQKEWEEVERTIKADEKKLKKEQKRRRAYETIKKTGAVLGFTILGITLVCGVLVVGAVAPNVFSAFGRIGRHRRFFNRKNFRNKVGYFKRRGYIVETPDDDLIEIRLTDSGKEYIAKHTLRNFKILPQKKWDGIWRVVIFDVPERNKWGRDGLRRSLKNLGFYQLQKSTFVYPYPCRAEVDFLRDIYNMDDSVHFLETSRASFDNEFRERFHIVLQ